MNSFVIKRSMLKFATFKHSIFNNINLIFTDFKHQRVKMTLLRFLAAKIKHKNKNNFLNSNKKNLFKFVYVQGVDIVQKK
ncbi:hypothetical protein BpHYR1_029629 [Brachionus plicatilis]|uniref:Uncharacterized protein n=1 Tax=Brachionus plicatilis TaxID=10195 RepID=A0A3M7RCS6_BRAPC|nr:hypothetical protein BpHYR1_029629 [Brachionus plicatilis]